MCVCVRVASKLVRITLLDRWMDTHTHLKWGVFAFFSLIKWVTFPLVSMLMTDRIGGTPACCNPSVTLKEVDMWVTNTLPLRRNHPPPAPPPHVPGWFRRWGWGKGDGSVASKRLAVHNNSSVLLLPIAPAAPVLPILFSLTLWPTDDASPPARTLATCVCVCAR